MRIGKYIGGRRSSKPSGFSNLGVGDYVLVLELHQT